MKKKTGSKVLIVNDKLYLRKQIRQILVREGYEIVGEGNDGHDAIDLYRKHNPELLIIDMDLPLLDGIGAADVITRRYERAKILLIYDNHSRKNEGIDAGVMSFLRKPIEANLLLSKLLEMLASNPPDRSNEPSKPKPRPRPKEEKPVAQGNRGSKQTITKELHKKREESLKAVGMPTLSSGRKEAENKNIEIKKTEPSIQKPVISKKKRVKPEQPFKAVVIEQEVVRNEEVEEKEHEVRISIPVPSRIRNKGKEEDVEIPRIKEEVIEVEDQGPKVKPFLQMQKFKPRVQTKEKEWLKIKSFVDMTSYKPKRPGKEIFTPKIKPFAQVPKLKQRPITEDPYLSKIKPYAEMQLLKPKTREEDMDEVVPGQTVIDEPEFDEPECFEEGDEFDEFDESLGDIEFDIVSVDEGNAEEDGEPTSKPDTKKSSHNMHYESENDDSPDREIPESKPKDSSEDDDLEDLDDIEFEIG